jgi:DNA-binding HxlR family transcriptional regulator
MSSSVLSRRLTELRDDGIVEADADGIYRLTELGRGLQPALAPLRQWSADWAQTL